MLKNWEQNTPVVITRNIWQYICQLTWPFPSLIQHNIASVLALECGDTTSTLPTSLAEETQQSNNHNNSLRRGSTVPAEPPNTRRPLLTSSRASSLNGFLDFLLIFPPELREAVNVCMGHDSSPLPEAAVVVPVRDFAIKHGRLGRKHIVAGWNNKTGSRRGKQNKVKKTE